MSAFIVSGGSLLEVGCPSSLNRETAQQASFTSTLGGKRKAFIRRGGRRSWSVDVSLARPADVSTIEAVARNIGPYGWYGPEAVIGNLFSPQATGWDPTPSNGIDVGLAKLPDGSIAHAVAHTGEDPISVGNVHGGFEAIPILPGGTVSVGVWALGGVQASGAWLDQSLAPIGDWQASALSFANWEWSQDTLTPPAGAAFVTVTLSGGAQYARPSISWGNVARDEGGTGCPAAVIHSPHHSPLALWQGANYTASSYSITEVG